MALVTTVGGDDSDSYVALENADLYFANHYHVAKGTAWAELSTPQKEGVLRAAASVLDTLRFTDGLVHRAYWNQNLTFPRNIDWDMTDGYFIPLPVFDAQCEQAIYLVTLDETTLAAQIQGVSEEYVMAGPVRTSVKYVGATSMVAPLAYQLVMPFIRRSSQRQRA